MSEPILSALILTPVILGALASVAVWRLVSRPILFLAVSIFSLLGVQAVISPVAIASFLTPNSPAHDAFVRSVLAGTAGVVILGIPLLWWLFKGLRRA
jgi:hypothetical protein